MVEKNSFIFYDEWQGAFEELSLEDQGRLISAVLEYRRNGIEPELTGAVRMAFKFIRMQIDRDWEDEASQPQKREEQRIVSNLPLLSELEEFL